MKTEQHYYAVDLAAGLDTVDEACAMIQERLDVTDGGTAGQMFCDVQEPEDWQDLDRSERCSRLDDYAKTEALLRGMSLYELSRRMTAREWPDIRGAVA